MIMVFNIYKKADWSAIGLEWSGRRGSNSRPSAWKADALSTELLPQELVWAKMDSNHRRYKPADLQSAPFGHSGILPFLFLLGDSCVRLHIVGRSLPGGNSLPPRLPSLLSHQNKLKTLVPFKERFEPMEGIEPTTPRLQITCSGQLSYIGIVVLVRFGEPFP